MTQEKFRQRAAATVERIKAAPIDADLQDALVELIEDARISTNGLSPDEKIQLMSENQFSMAVLLVQSCLASLSRRDEDASAGWRGLIVKCRKEITVIAVVAMSLLVFRPHLLEVVTEVFR